MNLLNRKQAGGTSFTVFKASWTFDELDELVQYWQTSGHRGDERDGGGGRRRRQAPLPGCTQSFMMLQKALSTWPSSHLPALGLSLTTFMDVFLSYACNHTASTKLLAFFFFKRSYAIRHDSSKQQSNMLCKKLQQVLLAIVCLTNWLRTPECWGIWLI